MYLRDCITEIGGVDTIVLDFGYGRPAKAIADITADDVAIAAGSNIKTIRRMKDTGAASHLMMQGAILSIRELLEQERCNGVISFGGASNTTLATGVMKTLPTGIPKMVVSSAVAMPAYGSRFFGSRDITILHSIVDISGLNRLTRNFLAQGAAAIHGMVSFGQGVVEQPTSGKLIAVTSFRFAETCSQSVIRRLEQLGYKVIPFHAQGVGEDAMENLLGQGLFQGVIDLVPAGLSEQLFGGNRAARPDRLEAAGVAGIPQVVAPSGFDMISCGPLERRDTSDQLWTTRGIAKRQISVPDQFRVEARTSSEEVAEIGCRVAAKLNRAKAPACVTIPTRGWSSLSVEGGDLHSPESDAVLAPVLRGKLRDDISVVEVDAELNSEKFASVLVDQLISMLNNLERET